MNKEQIRQALARGYCTEANSRKTVDPVLMEAMADEVLSALSAPHPQGYEQTLALPGCERLRDFVETGPAQRAALELFVGALSAPEEVWRQFAFAKLGAVRDNMTDHEVEVVQRFLSGEPAPSALSAQPGTAKLRMEIEGIKFYSDHRGNK